MFGNTSLASLVDGCTGASGAGLLAAILSVAVGAAGTGQGGAARSDRADIIALGLGDAEEGSAVIGGGATGGALDWAGTVGVAAYGVVGCGALATAIGGAAAGILAAWSLTGGALDAGVCIGTRIDPGGLGARLDAVLDGFELGADSICGLPAGLSDCSTAVTRWKVGSCGGPT
jgi:hypothetical protein